jgi:hypothetical protein
MRLVTTNSQNQLKTITQNNSTKILASVVLASVLINYRGRAMGGGLPYVSMHSPTSCWVHVPTLKRESEVGANPDRWVFTNSKHPMVTIPDEATSPRRLGSDGLTQHVVTSVRRRWSRWKSSVPFEILSDTLRAPDALNSNYRLDSQNDLPQGVKLCGSGLFGNLYC